MFGIMKNKNEITVSGVTFAADQVKSATVVIEGREVYISEKSSDKQIGFTDKGEGVDA